MNKRKTNESSIQQDILLTFFNDLMLKQKYVTEEQYRRINNKIITISNMRI